MRHVKQGRLLHQLPRPDPPRGGEDAQAERAGGEEGRDGGGGAGGVVGEVGEGGGGAHVEEEHTQQLPRARPHLEDKGMTR